MIRFLPRLFIAALFSLPSISCFIPNTASAITIDTFEDADGGQGHLVTASNVTPGGKSVATRASSYSLGGARTIAVVRDPGSSNPGGTVEGQSYVGDFQFSQTAGVKGTSRIFWDGQSSKNPVGSDAVKYDGLNGLDLLEDGADKFVLSTLFFDFANAGPVHITVIVYDSSDPTGKKFSTLKKTLNRIYPTPGPTENLDFPFASFAQGAGATSAANFGNTGAIEIYIEGVTEGSDLSFANFITNGLCSHIPVGGLVYDQCGVCNGNNSSCSDCLGVPNGPAVAGTSCNTGDIGACATSIFTGAFPSCQCPVPPPGVEICNSIDDDCDGQTDEVFDLCGVQCGDNSSCKGCDGVPNSGKVPDACGVCGGDGSSCAGCDGVPSSGKKVDICGICGGDGTSCTTGCTKTVIKQTLFALDAQAKRQEKVIIRGARQLLEDPKAKRYVKAINELLAKAHVLQVTNWVLSWTFPEVIVACENTIVCSQSSNLEKIDTYRSNAKKLLDLNTDLAKYYRKLKLMGKARIQDRNGDVYYQHALELASTVPTSTTICNVPTTP